MKFNILLLALGFSLFSLLPTQATPPPAPMPDSTDTKNVIIYLKTEAKIDAFYAACTLSPYHFDPFPRMNPGAKTRKLSNLKNLADNARVVAKDKYQIQFLQSYADLCVLWMAMEGSARTHIKNANKQDKQNRKQDTDFGPIITKGAELKAADDELSLGQPAPL